MPGFNRKFLEHADVAKEKPGTELVALVLIAVAVSQMSKGHMLSK